MSKQRRGFAGDDPWFAASPAATPLGDDPPVDPDDLTHIEVNARRGQLRAWGWVLVLSVLCWLGGLVLAFNKA